MNVNDDTGSGLKPLDIEYADPIREDARKVKQRLQAQAKVYTGI